MFQSSSFKDIYGLSKELPPTAYHDIAINFIDNEEFIKKLEEKINDGTFRDSSKFSYIYDKTLETSNVDLFRAVKDDP